MISSNDRKILQTLAKRVAEIAALPIMEERRTEWRRHHRLVPGRPLVLVFPEGAWRELLPDSELQCSTSQTRAMEWELRSRIYSHKNFLDDKPVEARWVVSKRIRVSNWGVSPQHTERTQDTGSWKFIPVIQEFSDFKKLHYPEVNYDLEGSQQDLEEAKNLFGGILQVIQKGVAHVSFHLAQVYSDLRGLEQMYVDMVDHPDEMLEALEFFTRGYEQVLQQYQEMNLFSLNNDETYHSSGGVGYTTELPVPGFDPQRVRPMDMWASAESQELAVVSPRMHRKFALDFEKRLLQPFGLTGYGCCEDLGNKLQDVMEIPKIRRISISPFADVERCASQIGNRTIFSWKPQPQDLVGDFDPEQIRKYIAHALEVTRGCVVEMILKDTHTCEHHPERFHEWTRIARELIEP
jgi:hypothetical protein